MTSHPCTQRTQVRLLILSLLFVLGSIVYPAYLRSRVQGQVTITPAATVVSAATLEESNSEKGSS